MSVARLKQLILKSELEMKDISFFMTHNNMHKYISYYLHQSVFIKVRAHVTDALIRHLCHDDDAQ